MTRLIVRTASVVCRVPITRWPVRRRARQWKSWEIVHFSENDHLRVTTEGMNEGSIKGLGIIAKVTLHDDAFFVRMDKFNRVLDRDHMPPGVFIKVIQHRCLSSRFAGATGSDNQDQTGFLRISFLQICGKSGSSMVAVLIGTTRKARRGASLTQDIYPEAG